MNTMRWLALLIAWLTVGPNLISPQQVLGADDRCSEFLRLIPEDANAVAIVRVAEILKSPRAVKENWATKPTAFLAGSDTLPIWAESLVYGYHIHPEVPAEIWSVSVLALPPETDMARLAQREHSTVAQLAGAPAIETARNAYFIELKPKVVGTLRPAIRQDAARWIRAIQSHDEWRLSPYLATASAKPDQIVLALDLDEMLDPQRVRDYVRQLDAFKNRATAADELSTLMRGLSGLTLTVNVSQTVRAELLIDFQSPVGALAPDVKSVFFDLAQSRGLGLGDFEACEISTEDRRVRLVTALSDPGLRRVLSLVASPLPSKPRETSTEAIDIADTKRYFQAVQRVLDDLEKATNRGLSVSNMATWHDNYARKIDAIQTHEVDPELIAFAESMSAKLRALAASLRGVAIDVNAQEKTITYNMQYDPGWVRSGSVWGNGAGYRPPTVNWTSNLKEVRERQAELVARGTARREEIWKMIRDEREAIESRLRTKYGRTFQ